MIRIHHRAVAAPIRSGWRRPSRFGAGGGDLWDGEDPNPGSGIYFVRNGGAAWRITARAVAGPATGDDRAHRIRTSNTRTPNCRRWTCSGNGEKLLVVGTQLGDGFRGYVYRPAKNRIALEHTGMVLPPISIEERLLDLDGDGQWEYVRSGGESLIAKVAKLIAVGDKP